MVTALVKKFLWDNKLRYEIPTLSNLKNFLHSELTRINFQNRKFGRMFRNSVLFRNNANFHF